MNSSFQVWGSLRFTSGIAFYLFMPFLSVWLQKQPQLTFSDTVMLAGSLVFVSRGGMLLIPMILPNMSLRTSLLVSYGICFLGFLSLFLWPEANLFLYCVILWSIGFGFCAATLCMKTAISQVEDPGWRIAAFSWLNLAINGAAALGPVFAGYIMSDAHRFLPLSCAVAQGVSICLVFFLPNMKLSKHQDLKEVKTRRPSLLAEKKLILFSCFSFLTFLGYSQLFGVFPLFTSSIIDEKIIGLFFAINAAIVLALQIPISKFLAPRIKHSSVLLWNLIFLSQVLHVIAIILLGFRNHISILAVGVVVFSLAELIWSPLFDGVARDVSGRIPIMRATGVLGLCAGLGESLGTALGLALVPMTMHVPIFANPFFVVAVVMALAMVVIGVPLHRSVMA